MREGSIALIWLLMVGALNSASLQLLQRPFHQWTLRESIELLNDSPWARQVTFTNVIEGVGSGVRGEKEILDTFYVRLLSALPIRQALARIEQINHGYDELERREQRRFDQLLADGLGVSMHRWIVVTVSFRCNDPERENQIGRYLQTQTADMIKNQAFLSTSRHPRLRLREYFPPANDGIGARFVFPRFVQGKEIVQGAGDSILFQLELPDLQTPLNVTFALGRMQVDGELLL